MSSSDDLVDSDSMPSLKESSDLDIFESCDGFGSSLREIARCRSSSESLMWSASRRSCEGFDMLGGSLGAVSGSRVC